MHEQTLTQPLLLVIWKQQIVLPQTAFGVMIIVFVSSTTSVTCAIYLLMQTTMIVCSPMQALGCILYLLCFKQHPFEDGAKLQIVNGKYSIPQNDVKYTVYHDLIRKCRLSVLVVCSSTFPTRRTLKSHLSPKAEFT